MEIGWKTDRGPERAPSHRRGDGEAALTGGPGHGWATLWTPLAGVKASHLGGEAGSKRGVDWLTWGVWTVGGLQK